VDILNHKAGEALKGGIAAMEQKIPGQAGDNPQRLTSGMNRPRSYGFVSSLHDSIDNLNSSRSSESILCKSTPNSSLWRVHTKKGIDLNIFRLVLAPHPSKRRASPLSLPQSQPFQSHDYLADTFVFSTKRSDHPKNILLISLPAIER
jgi:hypothetical protein